MSNYMKRQLVFLGRVTPSSAQAAYTIPFPNGGLFHSLITRVVTQGTAATHKVTAATDEASPTTLVTHTVGTDAAKTVKQTKALESVAVIASASTTTSSVTITGSVADSTAVYDLWAEVTVD